MRLRALSEDVAWKSVDQMCYDVACYVGGEGQLHENACPWSYLPKWGEEFLKHVSGSKDNDDPFAEVSDKYSTGPWLEVQISKSDAGHAVYGVWVVDNPDSLEDVVGVIQVGDKKVYADWSHILDISDAVKILEHTLGAKVVEA